MESKRSRCASLLWAGAVAVAMLSHNFVISTPNFDDNKNYYSPDPNTPNHPTVPHITPPPHGSGGGGGPHPIPTPYHGTPPSHGGGGSGGGSPPVNCGNPPSGHHHTTPSPPTGGGGGYYHSPPTTVPVTPTPTTPIVSSPPPIITPPIVHTPPTIPVIGTPPTIPVIGTPPTTPIIGPGTPSIPGITIPSPPFSFDPNSPPFTCTYWRNHPTLIWGLFGWWGTTVGSAFGISGLPGVGANMNILQALSNTRSDGFGQLYREGTAALLNSVAHTRFPYTSSQVRDRFVAGLSSNKAAAQQAQLFKHANEGKTKPRA